MAPVAFRVDASPSVGAGHLARCRALAGALRKRGRGCHFVVGAGARPWIDTLRAELDTVDVIEDGLEWRDDAEQTLARLAPVTGTAWMVVDHYRLDARWQRAARSAGWRVLVVDDLADRPLAADALLDPAPTASEERYRALVPPDCALLLGPRHCLLRGEFAELRALAAATPRRAGRVHLAFGGTLREAELAAVARPLLEQDPQLELVTVVPSASPLLAQLAQQFRERIVIHVQPASVARTMLGCDVALGAPGGMLWERFCLGLPTACLAVSPVQVPVLAALASQGWLLDLGSAADFAAQRLARFRQWQADRPAREADRQRLMQAVDGQGAARVADWLVAHHA
jgi:UDP-2,4-diacetamido-2,4,6-trideoxy-beta-L-altropyranose hydrolase